MAPARAEMAATIADERGAASITFALLLNLVAAANAETKAPALEVHRQIRAWRHAREPSSARSALRLCDRLLRGLREADEEVPRARPKRSARAFEDSDRALRSPARRHHRRRVDPERSLRRSARSTGSSRCAIGSKRSTKCCSARSKARASARSRRSSACAKPLR